MWTFAVRYGFPELEEFCISDERVKRDILSKLRTQDVGITYFLDDAQLPIATVNKLIAAILTQKTWIDIVRNRSQEESKRPNLGLRFSE